MAVAIDVRQSKESYAWLTFGGIIGSGVAGPDNERRTGAAAEIVQSAELRRWVGDGPSAPTMEPSTPLIQSAIDACARGAAARRAHPAPNSKNVYLTGPIQLTGAMSTWRSTRA